MVNELRGGLTAYASGSNFGYPSSITSRNDPSTFADSGGFAITTPGNTTDWFTSNSPSWRKAPTYSVEDTLTWNRGAHTITDRRQRAHLERRRPRARRWSAGSRSGSTRTSIRRPACSTRRTSPAHPATS